MGLYVFDLGNGLKARVKDNICTPDGLELWVRIMRGDTQVAMPFIVPVAWDQVLPPDGWNDDTPDGSSAVIEATVREYAASVGVLT